MVKLPPAHELGPVSCMSCQREIPHAKAMSIEGKEYAYFFCGYGCYQHWRQGEGRQERPNGKSHGASDP